MTMNIRHLSNDLHLFMTSFLDEKEKIIFGSCCNRYYKDLLLNYLRVFQTFRWSEFFSRYEEDRNFREKVDKCLPFPERQIHMNLPDNSLPLYFPFPKIYSLSVDLDSFQNLMHRVEKVQNLELTIHSTKSYSEIILTKDYNIKRLIIENDADEHVPLPIVSPPFLEGLELHGTFSPIPSFLIDGFPYLKELSLNHVDNISNVSIFANIPKITLSHCNSIVDITPLQTTRDISIKYCKGILDYRNALTYSRRITIILASNCKALVDVNCFKAVQSLTIFNFGRLNTTPLPITLKRLMIHNTHIASNFNHLQELSISSSLVNDVKCLSRIPFLTLSELDIVSLQGLGFDEDPNMNMRNQKIVAKRLAGVKDFSPLNSVQTVEIFFCKGFCNIGEVKNVKNLSIEHCLSVLLSTPIMSEKFTYVGEMDDSAFLCFQNVKVLDLSGVSIREEVNWARLQMFQNLERLIIPRYWVQQIPKIWEILKHNFSQFWFGSTFIYVKKLS